MHICRCAGHLNMLCISAIKAYKTHGLYSNNSNNNSNPPRQPTGNQRGLLVNYDSLPGIVPKALLPLFGVSRGQISPTWIASMQRVSTKYSKGRSSGASFNGDSKQKSSRATGSIKKYALSILQPSYRALLGFSVKALGVVLSPEEFAAIQLPRAIPVVPDPNPNPNPIEGDQPESESGSGSETGHVNININWSELRLIETPLGNSNSNSNSNGNGNLRTRNKPSNTIDSQKSENIENNSGNQTGAPDDNSTIYSSRNNENNRIQHSNTVGIAREYYPFSPFSNTHESKPYKVCN